MSSVIYVVPFGGTTPQPLTMSTLETFTISFDWTNALAAGDSPTSPVSTLINTTPGPNAGAAITLANSPTQLVNVTSQIIVGSQLSASNSYRLTITCTLNTNKVQTAALQVYVPF